MKTKTVKTKVVTSTVVTPKTEQPTVVAKPIKKETTFEDERAYYKKTIRKLRVGLVMEALVAVVCLILYVWG